jgi:hypothetical protein
MTRKPTEPEADVLAQSLAQRSRLARALPPTDRRDLEVIQRATARRTYNRDESEG